MMFDCCILHFRAPWTSKVSEPSLKVPGRPSYNNLCKEEDHRSFNKQRQTCRECIGEVINDSSYQCALCRVILQGGGRFQLFGPAGGMAFSAPSCLPGGCRPWLVSSHHGPDLRRPRRVTCVCPGMPVTVTVTVTAQQQVTVTAAAAARLGPHDT
jgi:hypothetical protein